MKISTKGRYGLKAMVDIAVHNEDGNISLASISERQGISENYLEQLMSALRVTGLVQSVRGAKGGYTLTRHPQDILVGEILRALEGSLYPVECISDDGKSGSACGSANCDVCVTKSVWEKVYESVCNTLDSITLEDLANEYKAKQQ